MSCALFVRLCSSQGAPDSREVVGQSGGIRSAQQVVGSGAQGVCQGLQDFHGRPAAVCLDAADLLVRNTDQRGELSLQKTLCFPEESDSVHGHRLPFNLRCVDLLYSTVCRVVKGK